MLKPNRGVLHEALEERVWGMGGGHEDCTKAEMLAAAGVLVEEQLNPQILLTGKHGQGPGSARGHREGVEKVLERLQRTVGDLFKVLGQILEQIRRRQSG